MKKLIRFALIGGLLWFLFYCGVFAFNAENLDGIEDSFNEIKGKIEQVFDKKDLTGPYSVEKVIDGDTISIYIGVDEVKVRMIGIDTPESVSSDVSKNCEEGFIASEYTKSLLSNQSVYLEYDKEIKDKYDRTLAYVYLKQDGELVMVNRLLLEEGMAKTMTIEPNTKYAEEFKEIETEAKLNKTGFWSGSVFR